jgi:16S rRNA processing protein RimM|tara:strand:+ start:893 stop:1423 length:531 start_codon:yes stop_codon:yes gene_type:complete
MKLKDCYFIGHISRKHGFKGDLLVKLDVDDPSRYKNLESVFLDRKGRLIPFFLSSCKLTQKGFLHIHFEGVDTEIDADRLCKSGLYLPLSFLPPMEGNKFYYHEIEGYKVIDRSYGEIGIMKEVVNEKVQPLFAIENGLKEVLIPIIDSVIDELDRENKILYLTCPEGLIEVYLDS